MRKGFINPRVHQPEENKRKTLRESVPVIGFVIRQVNKPGYLLFIVCFTLFSVCYLSMYLVRRYLSLLDFVLRQVILYVLFIYRCSSGNIASDYVDLLLLSLEIVRRVRVHKQW